MKKNNRVLFIAYLFPPILNSGIYRSIKFVKYLPKFGWEPIVLTVDQPPDQPIEPALLQEVPQNTNIIRVPMFSWSIANSIARMCPSKWRARFVEGIEWRLRRFWRIPDVHAAWKRSAVKAALKIYKSIPFDIIFATGYPWTSFLAGKEISRLLNKPLVLDYRDPWTGGTLWNSSGKNLFLRSFLRSFLLEKINRSLEEGVVKQAKVLISTTEPFAKELSLFRSKNPNLKIYTITNGYDPDDFKSIGSILKKDPFKVYIVFVGVWKNGYGPEALYRALKLLKEKNDSILAKLKVICAGFSPGQAEKFGVSDLVEELGFIPYKEALSLLKAADILYMSVPEGRFSKMCLPGKLFDYIGAEKPILISALPDSYVVNFLKKCSFVCVSKPNDIVGLIDKLKIMINNLDVFTCMAEQPIMLRRKINRKNLAKKLSEIFDNLCVCL